MTASTLAALKIRIGRCVFTDPTGEVEERFPGFNENLNAFLIQTSTSRDAECIVSSDYERSYRVEGSCLLKGKKILIRYKVLKGSDAKGLTVVLPAQRFANGKELNDMLAFSIVSEIEKMARGEDGTCKQKR